MKRLLPALLAGAALAVLLALAAPALSVRPYVPRPVDFEMAPPGAAQAARAAGSGAIVSTPLRAPKRFDLVGLRWRGGGDATISMRVRADGGRWSPWRTLDAETLDGPDPGRGEPAGGGVSAPMWAGQSDWVQWRTSRRLPGLRLHFVNSTGTATAADRVQTAVRRAANRGVMAVAKPALAQADAPQPGMVTRSQWGDQHCAPAGPPAYGEVKAAFVHHTVTANGYSREQAPAAVLAICRYHRYSNGWNDIGYNFLVDTYGTLYEGRAGGVDKAVVGAQAQGFNAQSTGISNIGTFTSVAQTSAALDAMARLVRWKLPVHGQPTGGTTTLTSAGGASNRWPAGTQVSFQRISGHRDGNTTSCPGAALYAQLPNLRQRVGGVWPNAPRTRLSAHRVRPAVVTFGRRTRLSGSLALLGGGALADAPIEVQQLDRAGWSVIGQARTRGDGTFSGLVTPPARRLLRARFPGTAAGQPSVSASLLVRVRAALTAGLAARVGAVGDKAVLAGTVGPAKPRVTVTVDRRTRGRYVRVATLRARGGTGRYARGYRPRAPGTYRLRAVFGGDRLHLAGRSRFAFLRAVARTGGVPPTPAP